MSEPNYPITPAVRFLRGRKVDFESYVYTYEEHGGTAQFTALFDIPEHQVVKTIVLQNEQKKGLVMLTHGDKHTSTRNLACSLGMKHIEPADLKQAAKWTGYLVGSTTPFGMKTALPVYVESSVWVSDTIYINGGKRGFIIGAKPEALRPLDPQDVNVAVGDWFFMQRKEQENERRYRTKYPTRRQQP